MQPYFHNYTTEDGLPSSEVYCSYQDKDGYIWFGTDNGVARFNGYEFTVFDGDDGLEDVVVFKLRGDHEGRMWASTFSGRLYYYEDGKFIPHPNNHILENWKVNQPAIELIAPDYYHGFLFSVMKTGLVYWDGEVNFEWIADVIKKPQSIHYDRITDPDFPLVNPIHLSHTYRYYGATRGNIYSLESNALRAQIIDTIIFDQLDGAFGLLDIDTINRSLLTASTDYYNLYEEGELSIRQQRKQKGFINYSIPLPGGGMLVGMDGSGGLEHLKKNSETNKIETRAILTGHAISFMNFDRNGGLWVCSLDNGVYYSPKPTSSFFDPTKQFPTSSPPVLALVDEHTFFVNYGNGSTYYMNVENDQVILAKKVIQSTADFSLFFDHTTQQLFGAKSILKLETTAGTIALNFTNFDHINDLNRGSLPSSFLSMSKNYQLIESGQERILLASGISCLLALDLKANKLLYFKNNIREGGPFLNIHTYTIDQNGCHRVGTLHGLYEYIPERNKLIPNDLGIPQLRERIVKIASLPNGGLLFGSRGNGVIYYDQDTSFTISTVNGLASNMIRDIHIDEANNIWIATLTGLSKLNFAQFDTGNYNYQLRTFGLQHGLASEEIYDVDSHGPAVWLATAKGIMKFNEPEINEQSLPPVLGGVSLNGKRVSERDLRDLPTGNYHLRLSFYTISHQQLGNINYRYRIAANANWTTTSKTEVDFPNLPAGIYRFEVQSQNEDGIWSRSLLLPINIAAPWYTHWAIWPFFAVLLITAISIFFRLRDIRRQKTEAINKQIAELERSALHAQMNPHFIFNSLNSIQSFILDKDTRSAVNYLAKFARLIRDTLRVSVEGQHSLESEIAMLRNYLSLEKLRFKEGFEYDIVLGKDITPNQITLPPLLIQPFVENAIKHGIENNGKQGKVQIHFGGSKEILQVSIQDNGRGYDFNKSKRPDAMGMDITRRRLELIQGKISNDTSMDIRLCYDESGYVSGTEIIISIMTKLKKKPLK